MSAFWFLILAVQFWVAFALAALDVLITRRRGHKDHRVERMIITYCFVQLLFGFLNKYLVIDPILAEFSFLVVGTTAFFSLFLLAGMARTDLVNSVEGVLESKGKRNEGDYLEKQKRKNSDTGEPFDSTEFVEVKALPDSDSVEDNKDPPASLESLL